MPRISGEAIDTSGSVDINLNPKCSNVFSNSDAMSSFLRLPPASALQVASQLLFNTAMFNVSQEKKNIRTSLLNYFAPLLTAKVDFRPNQVMVRSNDDVKDISGGKLFSLISVLTQHLVLQSLLISCSLRRTLVFTVTIQKHHGSHGGPHATIRSQQVPQRDGDGVWSTTIHRGHRRTQLAASFNAGST